MRKIVYVGPYNNVTNRFGDFTKDIPASVDDEIAIVLLRDSEFADPEVKKPTSEKEIKKTKEPKKEVNY